MVCIKMLISTCRASCTLYEGYKASRYNQRCYNILFNLQGFDYFPWNPLDVELRKLVNPVKCEYKKLNLLVCLFHLSSLQQTHILDTPYPQNNEQ